MKKNFNKICLCFVVYDSSGGKCDSIRKRREGKHKERSIQDS